MRIIFNYSVIALPIRLNPMLHRLRLSCLVLGLLAMSGLGKTVSARQSNEKREARRVLATSSLAAKEYGNGVSGGITIAVEEVEEARLFLGETAKSAKLLPEVIRDDATTIVSSMQALVEQLGDPSQLRTLSDSLDLLLNGAIPGLTETLPALRPDSATGARVYAASCASCHGETGGGDGPAGIGLNPAPSNLTDAQALADQAPLDFYRKVLIGVSGTAMPPFEGTLSDDEIWAAAWHATMVRYEDSAVARGGKQLTRGCSVCSNSPVKLPFPAYLPSDLADPERVARLTDEELVGLVLSSEAIGGTELDSASAMEVVGYLRTLPFAETHAGGVAATFGLVRTEIIRGLRLARLGQADEAMAKMVDAYAAFEAVESDIGVRNRRLVSEVEFAFAELRSNVANGGSPGLEDSFRSVDRLLDRSQALLERRTSPAGFFVQSFLLLLREGVEALLIVGALAALVVRAGTPRNRNAIWWGVGAALAASVATAIAIETIFRIGVAQQELLEGITMLVATGVLLVVSYWLISKVEVHRWKRFLANQGTRAVKQGSLLALASASFLAVYREGFETVLFYKALIITADGSSLGAIGAGAVMGATALAFIYLLITRFGMRLPIRPFFAVTSAVLLYMAFSFAGKGIAELQESNLLSTTIVDWAPRVPWMGIYPTTQSMAMQASIVGLVVIGLIWTFILEPRISPQPVRRVGQ